MLPTLYARDMVKGQEQMRWKGLPFSFSLYPCIFCHSYLTLLDTVNLSICQLLIEIIYPRFWVFSKALMSLCLTVTVPNGCCWVTWKSMQRSMWALCQGQALWFTLFSPCLVLQNIYVFCPEKWDTCTRFVAVAEVRGLALLAWHTASSATNSWTRESRQTRNFRLSPLKTVDTAF